MPGPCAQCWGCKVNKIWSLSILHDAGTCWGPTLWLFLGAQPAPQLLNAPTCSESSCLAFLSSRLLIHKACLRKTERIIIETATYRAPPPCSPLPHGSHSLPLTTKLGVGNFHPHFTDDKTKAQTDEVTCPSSQRKQVAELGLTPNLFS